MQISTLDILRCPYCGGRLELVTSLFHRRRRRRDSRRHPRLPLLHLSGRRRHPGAAPAAAGRPRRASTSRRAVPISRCGRWSASRTRAQAAAFERGRLLGRRDLSRHRRRARTELRGRIFPVSLLRSDLRRRPGRRAGGGGHGAARDAARDRRLRRIRAPDAVAAGSVVAGRRCSPICTSPKIWLGAAVHGARLRARVLRRQRAAAVRARRLRLRDVLGRVHVHLDEAAVRRRDDAPDRRRPANRARSSSTTRTTSSRGARRTVSRCRRQGYRDLFEIDRAARLRRSRPLRATWSTAGRSTSRGATPPRRWTPIRR